jgi:hypothetical protein
MKLRGLSPNSYIHVSVSDLYVHSLERSAYYVAGKIGELIIGTYKTLTET